LKRQPDKLCFGISQEAGKAGGTFGADTLAILLNVAEVGFGDPEFLGKLSLAHLVTLANRHEELSQG
jgi:hypothetical protein